eukprot:PhM_4_TR4730/c0_g1_i1/m.59471
MQRRYLTRIPAPRGHTSTFLSETLRGTPFTSTPARSFFGSFGGGGGGNKNNNNSNEKGFLERLLAKNTDSVKKAVEMQQKAYQRACEEAKSKGQPPPPPPPPLPEFVQKMLKHAEKTGRMPDGSNPFTAMSEALKAQPAMQQQSSTSSPPPAQQQSPTLPQHMEELFAELSHRRARIHELNLVVDDLKSQNAELKKQLGETKSTEERVRSQLKRTDTKAVDQADEIRSLKEKEKELAVYRSKLDAANAELNKLKAKNAPNEHNVARIQELTTSVAEKETQIRRLEKRVERLRSQSPGLVALQNVVRTLSAACPAEDEAARDAADAALVDVIRRYSSVLESSWADHRAKVGTVGAVVTACRTYVRSVVAHSMLDCTVAGGTACIPADLRTYLETEEGLVFVDKSDGTTLVYCPELKYSGGAAAAIGACGIMTCLKTSKIVEGLGAIRPCLSQETIDAAKRTHIEHEKTRSSKPGGQAANVTETHVTAKLLLDGAAFARSECQDTRSQHENIKIAESRLMKEHVTKKNATFAEVGKEAPGAAVAGSLAADAKMVLGDVSDAVAAEKLSRLDEAVVRAVLCL